MKHQRLSEYMLHTCIIKCRYNIYKVVIYRIQDASHKNSKAFNQSQKLLYLLFNLVYIEFHGGNIFEEVNG